MNAPAIELPDPAPGETAPYCIAGTAKAKPGQAEALARRLLDLVAPTRAEPGALEYHVHRDRDDPDLFVFYEAWRSVEHLRAHLGRPYIASFLAERMTYLERDMEMHWVAMLSPYAR